MEDVNIPSNKDINSTLKEVKQAIKDTKGDTSGLNKKGKEILDTTENIVSDTQALVRDKNEDELVQQIVEESKRATRDLQENRDRWRQLQSSTTQLDTSKIKDQLNRINQTAKLLAIELLTSADFRQSVYDFFSVLYGVMVDASGIERLTQPLSEAFKEGSNTTDKLREFGQQATSMALDAADREKRVVALTDEQVNVLVRQFQEILQTVTRRERSQRIINGSFEIFQILKRPVLAMADQAQGAAEDVEENEHVLKVMDLSKQLFEAFTGHRTLDPMLSHMKVIYRSVVEDEEMSQYFTDMRRFIEDCISHPERIADPDRSRDDIEGFIRRGRTLVDKKAGLKENFNVMIEETRRILYELENDPITRSLQRDVERLVQLLVLDKHGNVTFKPEMLQQLKLIVLSALVKRMRVPLPPVHFEDEDKMEFTVTGLMLKVQDIVPGKIVAENRGIAELNLMEVENPEVTRASEAIRIRMEGIHVHMSDADVWFNRKTFPKVEDSGTARIDVGGRGMDIVIILRTTMNSDNIFDVARVDCDIHDLTLRLEDTRHDTLYNAFIVLFKSNIKNHIESAIEESMRNTFENLNSMLKKQAKTLKKQISAGAH